MTKNDKTGANKDTPRPTPQKEEPATARRPASKGKSPTRYGDWEKDGRCIDF